MAEGYARAHYTKKYGQILSEVTVLRYYLRGSNTVVQEDGPVRGIEVPWEEVLRRCRRPGSKLRLRPST